MKFFQCLNGQLIRLTRLAIFVVLQRWCSLIFALFFVINSRTVIAGAIIGLLLVFYDSKRSIGFLSVFFLQEVYLFTRHFDLKAKVRKAVFLNRFSLSERNF